MAVLRLMTSSNLVGLYDRQVGRLLALENAAGVDADLTICISKVRAVAHQAASRGKLAIDKSRGSHGGRQGSELLAAAGEERIGADEEGRRPARPTFAKAASKSPWLLALTTLNCSPSSARLLRESSIWSSVSVALVGLTSTAMIGRGHQLAQQLQPLRLQLGGQENSPLSGCRLAERGWRQDQA